jgi:hypothetical protein
MSSVSPARQHSITPGSQILLSLDLFRATRPPTFHYAKLTDPAVAGSVSPYPSTDIPSPQAHRSCRRWICFALPVHRPTTRSETPSEFGSPRSAKRKGRLIPEAPFPIVCPADAVLAKLPFPSKQGWITVGALLTSNQGLSLNRAQPSLHGN